MSERNTMRLPGVKVEVVPMRSVDGVRALEPLEVRGVEVYMVGIGGCGMSGLARMLRGRGARVSGSDSTASGFTVGLEREGIPVEIEGGSEGAAEGGVPEGCGLVVASAAIKPGHPRLLQAERRGLPVLSYAEALGRCMVGRTGIAVAGTHGKSTTTAMLGCVLADAGLDPTVIVGALCPQLGGGFRLGSERVPSGGMMGSPGILVAEACEFNRSFHHFRPRAAAITSVEADHLDVYGSLDAVIEAFKEFAGLLPDEDEGGTLLIAHEGAQRTRITAGLRCRVLTVGFSPSADLCVGYEPGTGRTTLSWRDRGVEVSWTMHMPGEHNAMNSAFAAGLALVAGAEAGRVGESLSGFRGLHRRMELLGERAHPLGGVVRVYDDYGHHPTEVDATLRALRAFERPQERGGRVVCVFQPHQHSRTRFLLDEFASAFSGADVVIVPHIYFVRDSIEEKMKVGASDLVDRLRARGVQAMHLYPFEAIVEQLENVCRPGDLLVVMGAGPVDAVARGYLAAGRGVSARSGSGSGA